MAAFLAPVVAPGVDVHSYANFFWCNCAGCATVPKPVITGEDYMAEGCYFASATATLEHLWFHCSYKGMGRSNTPVRFTDACHVMRAKRAAGTVKACDECARRRLDIAEPEEV